MDPAEDHVAPVSRMHVNRRRFLGVAAGTAGAVTAAAVFPAAAQASIPSGDPESVDDGFDSVPPNEVSFVPITRQQVLKAVAQLDGVAKTMLKTSGVPGLAFAVVYRGKVLLTKGYGVRKVGQPQKIDPRTVFQIASLSKAVASTVVAGAVKKGGLSWDDPIVKYLPSFSMGDPYVTAHITIADMFSHRSGLPDHAGDLMEDLGFSRDQILATLGKYPMKSFRDNYDYTNFGLTAGAVAAATSKGLSWQALSRQVLYGPLGMTSTSSTYAELLRETNRAALHVKVNGKWVAKYQRDADAQSPAGGVNSSVTDLAKWLILQLGGGKFNGRQIIPAASLLETHIPHYTSSPADSLGGRSGSYALGFNVNVDPAGRLRLSHSGAFELGAGTAFDMLPSEELGIVSLTNGQALGVPESLNATFYDLVELGRPSRDWLAAYLPRFQALAKNPSVLAGKKPPSHPIPAKPNSAYVGTYTNPIYGTAVVSAGSKGLTLALGPIPQRFRLGHWNGNLFSYFPTGETATGIAAVTFGLGYGDSSAGSVNVELLNGNPLISPTLGTFTKA